MALGQLLQPCVNGAHVRKYNCLFFLRTSRISSGPEKVLNEGISAVFQNGCSHSQPAISGY